MTFNAFLRLAIAVSAFALIPLSAREAAAADWSIKEVRAGVTGSIQARSTFEPGFFPTVALYFDPLDRANAVTWKDTLLRPRVNVGASVSTAGEASQIFVGLAWTVDVTDRFYIELGFGGAAHNGDNKDDGTNGPKLGCTLMFRESAAAGFRLTDKLDLVASIDHSSNADLCDPNDGISHAGLSLAYKF
ncbi:MAG: acyloxyacyl hydrolase [Alphaproteobacteria bacterium]|nr:acyloxyacyl hydrolase [Rhizobiaceae bacterium]MBU3960645.1 acyloxyacyl hydrolase [Alphaproteobacteria bacterium]MBU4049719.1 acyloxyacyl hydrolase [Alphaproteobacteria bacterium]MBU4091015.1 acyloxyacyl hydrolase [Alphaproteobacteria bacterium]MBU4155026.1 acyloxyacyl hydrolase [Alphaproteobacteria bacterium]